MFPENNVSDLNLAGSSVEYCRRPHGQGQWLARQGVGAGEMHGLGPDRYSGGVGCDPHPFTPPTAPVSWR
jgi:hypothetical protein